MTRESEKARKNAIALEARKDGLTQRQSGDWVLRLTVQSIDMHQRIVMAAMGTRYQCAFVEISDNEEPLDHQAMARDKWRALNPTQQAGIRCSDPIFWAFLTEFKKIKPDVNDHEAAAQVVRSYCGVTSRSQLNKPGFQRQRVLWHHLDGEFQAWKLMEAHGGD